LSRSQHADLDHRPGKAKIPLLRGKLDEYLAQTLSVIASRAEIFATCANHDLVTLIFDGVIDGCVALVANQQVVHSLICVRSFIQH
jgi:hypothetical protein